MGLKIPKFTITQTANTADGFYPLIGPFLARREIVKELGAPVWDDNTKIWFVAQSDEVLGFISVTPGTWRTIHNLYVVPDARGAVIGSALLVKVLQTWPTDSFRAIATPASVHLFKTYGFAETGTRGSYAVLELVRGAE